MIRRHARRIAAFTLFGTVVVFAASLSVDRDAVSRLFGAGERVSKAEAHFDASWSRAPVWDDGLAEISIFDATRPVDGAPQRYTATFVITKELLDPRRLAPVDSSNEPRRLIPVLKLNVIEEVAAQGASLSALTSTYVRRDDPRRLVRANCSRQEWLGNTFEEIVVRGGEARLSVSSYRAEAAGESHFDVRFGDLTTEQLPLALRGLRFRQGLTATVRLLPPLSSGGPPPSAPVPARIIVDGRETIAAAGGVLDTWRVFVEREGGEIDILWFDAAEMGGLVRWDAADGRRFNLVSRQRRCGTPALESHEITKGEAGAPPIVSWIDSVG